MSAFPSAKKRSFAFFFGSGMSYDSYKIHGCGAGSVANITRRLFEEDWQYSAERFFLPAPGIDPIFFEETRRCQEFLRLVKEEIDPHLKFRDGHESHYEDLYAAVYHLWNDELEEVVSPLIARSGKELRSRSEPIWSKMSPGGTGQAFRDLLRHSLALIQAVVGNELGRSVDPVGLSLISKMARRVDTLDIFTLNHDGLVEKQLKADGVAYTDGFEDKQSGYRIFSPKWGATPVRILKLHGSLDWSYCLFTKKDGLRFEQTAIFDVPADKCSYEGRPIEVRGDLQFLTGTTVKENSYGYDIIGDLFIKFRELSSEHRTMVFCGYGWGDKGINIRINQWLRDQPINKAVILHRDDPRFVMDKRFWQTRWAKYQATGKVKILPHWLPDCGEDELFAELVF